MGDDERSVYWTRQFAERLASRALDTECERRASSDSQQTICTFCFEQDNKCLLRSSESRPRDTSIGEPNQLASGNCASSRFSSGSALRQARRTYASYTRALSASPALRNAWAISRSSSLRGW